MAETTKDKRFAARCQPSSLPIGGWRVVLLRDPCVYCFDVATTIEHIHPALLGGSDSWKNTAPACVKCNVSRGHEPLLIWLVRGGFGRRPLGRHGRRNARKRLRKHLAAEARSLNGWNRG
jgi:hypothetical protein